MYLVTTHVVVLIEVPLPVYNNYVDPFATLYLCIYKSDHKKIFEVPS